MRNKLCNNSADSNFDSHFKNEQLLDDALRRVGATSSSFFSSLALQVQSCNGRQAGYTSMRVQRRPKVN